MRVKVEGDEDMAAALAGNLRKAGFTVGGPVGLFGTGYSIQLERTVGSHILVDGIDCPFERHVINCISQLSDTPLLLQRAGGVQSDRAIRVVSTARTEDDRAVELALVRALEFEVQTQPASEPKTADVGAFPKWRLRLERGARRLRRTLT